MVSGLCPRALGFLGGVVCNEQMHTLVVQFRFFYVHTQSKVLLTVCHDMEEKACCYPNQDNEIEEAYYEFLTAGDRCKEELVGPSILGIICFYVVLKLNDE